MLGSNLTCSLQHSKELVAKMTENRLLRPSAVLRRDSGKVAASRPQTLSFGCMAVQSTECRRAGLSQICTGSLGKGCLYLRLTTVQFDSRNHFFSKCAKRMTSAELCNLPLSRQICLSGTPSVMSAFPCSASSLARVAPRLGNI